MAESATTTETLQPANPPRDLQRSSFWKLSAELRNEIYDLASLTPGGVFIELTLTSLGDYEWQLKPRTCQTHPLALTEVSKEMREETIGAFLAVNEVSLIVPMLDDRRNKYYPKPNFYADKIKTWLHALHPKERAALKTVELDLGSWPIEYRRRSATEKQLATILHGLAMTMHANGVRAVVWLNMSESPRYSCVADRKRLPVSFPLSAFDIDSLRSAMKTIRAKKRAAEADCAAGRFSHDQSVYLNYHAEKCLMRLEELATALEKKQSTARRAVGERSRPVKQKTA